MKSMVMMLMVLGLVGCGQQTKTSVPIKDTVPVLSQLVIRDVQDADVGVQQILGLVKGMNAQNVEQVKLQIIAYGETVHQLLVRAGKTSGKLEVQENKDLEEHQAEIKTRDDKITKLESSDWEHKILFGVGVVFLLLGAVFVIWRHYPEAAISGALGIGFMLLPTVLDVGKVAIRIGAIVGVLGFVIWVVIKLIYTKQGLRSLASSTALAEHTGGLVITDPGRILMSNTQNPLAQREVDKAQEKLK